MKIHGSLALKLCLCAVAAAPLAVATTPPTLSASPSAVFFEYNPPEPMPLPVFVTVTASNASTPTIAAAISAGSGTPVTLFPGPAVTGDKLQVYYDNATFEQLSSQPGVYTATITVTASGFTALKIPVTLNIGGPLSIIPSATTLSFFVPGPTSQSVSLSASGGASIGFSVAFTTSGGGNWLSVVSNQSYMLATLTVTVNSLNIAAALTRVPSRLLQHPATPRPWLYLSRCRSGRIRSPRVLFRSVLRITQAGRFLWRKY